MSWGAGIIYELFEQLRNSSADIIIASPYMKGGGMLNVPFSRVLPSRIGNIILSLALSGRISTLSGMTRGYRGDVLRSLCLREDGKEIHLEIIAKALAENFVIKEIPATVRWPEGRSGKAGVGGLSLKTVKLIFTHLFFGFSQRPLLLFGPPAFLCLLAGLLAGGWLAFKYFIMNAVIGGQIVLVLISVFLIITGLQFFIICFLAYQAKDTQIRLFQLQNALNRFEKAITAGDND
jgi:hypothetical protein